MAQFRPRTRFSLLNTQRDVSSLAHNGKEIWDLLFERDRNKGAYFTEILGLMGSGKTSLMFGMADKAIRENPKELNFLREPEGNPVQYTKLVSGYQLFHDRRYPVTLYEIVEGEPPVPVDDVTIRPFTGIQELIRKAHPQQMNVVYFRPDELYKWYYLIDRLKLDAGWQSIWLDEAEDVFPLNAQGQYYEANTSFATSAKQIRKGRVNLVYNTQNSHDCDWRLRYKVMVWFYLRGSRVDQMSPVYQGAISNLEPGAAYVDLCHGRFGMVSFKPYYPRDREFVVLSPKDLRSRDG